MNKQFDAYDAQLSVEGWRIRALGRRPEDFMGRDNLVASLIRDPRGASYQHLLRKPIHWMEELVAHLTKPAEQIQALQLVVLHYLHLQTVGNILASNSESYSLSFQNVLERVWHCTPMGAIFERRDGTAHKHRICGCPKICPWCNARLVLDLWRMTQSLDVTQHSGQRSFLIRALGSIRSDDIEGWRRGPIGNMHQDNRSYSGWKEEVAYVNKELRPQLLDRAKYLGIQNGMTIFQAGPRRAHKGGPTLLQQIVGLLGHVSFDSPREEKAFKNKLRLDSKYSDPLPLRLLGKPHSIDWHMVPADHESAFRVMIAGSSVKYRIDNLDLLGAAEDLRGRVLPDGIPGILSLQPTYLFNAAEFILFDAAMKDIKVVSPFGTWKRARGAERDAIDERRIVQQGIFARRKDPRQKLLRANAGRKKAARQKREEMLPIAKELWPKVQKMSQGSPHRPAHRRHLAEEMREAGHPVGTRILAWLVGQLQKSK